MKLELIESENNPWEQKLSAALDASERLEGELKENYQPIAFYLTEGEELLGGVQGWYEWNWLYINQLWVGDQHRGFGTMLMDKIENAAQLSGKTGVYLDNIATRARPFFMRRGYRLVGEIPHYFPDQNLYFRVKRFPA